MSTFDMGFWLGTGLYLLVLVVIFRFVGRWGWIGLIIRIICAALILIRLLAIIEVMQAG